MWNLRTRNRFGTESRNLSVISLVQVPIIFHVKKLEKMEGIDFFYVKLGQQVKSAI